MSAGHESPSEWSVWQCRSPRNQPGSAAASRSTKRVAVACVGCLEPTTGGDASENSIWTSYSQPRGPTLYGPSRTYHTPVAMGPARYGGVAQLSPIQKSSFSDPLQPRKPRLDGAMPRGSNSPISRLLPPLRNGSDAIRSE